MNESSRTFWCVCGDVTHVLRLWLHTDIEGSLDIDMGFAGHQPLRWRIARLWDLIRGRYSTRGFVSLYPEDVAQLRDALTVWLEEQEEKNRE